MPLKCPFCDKYYATKLLFSNHLSRVHGGNTHSVESGAHSLDHTSNEPPTPDRSKEIRPASSTVTTRHVASSINLCTPPTREVGPRDDRIQVGTNANSSNNDTIHAVESDQNWSSTDRIEHIQYEQTTPRLLQSDNEVDPSPDDTADQHTSTPRESEVIEGDISCDTYNFFKGFEDSIEDLYVGVSQPLPFPEHLQPPVQAVLDYCTKNTLTLGEAKELYSLLSFLECQNPQGGRPITTQFETAEAFSSYLDAARKHAVRREGWVTAVIASRFGDNKTGVFRPVFDLMVEKVYEAGGVESIILFREQAKDGIRFFSAPWNAQVMEMYQEELGRGARVLLIDIYSDGTTLSSSGTQSANNMRVRFENLRGHTHFWYEVGIVSSVIIYSDQQKHSAETIKKEKVELWHRFTFLAFKKVMQASQFGFMIDGVKVYPRLGINVADQVQERPSCGLKGHDSFFDCPHCLMPTRLRKWQDIQNTRKRKRVDSGSAEESATSFRTHNNEESHQEGIVDIVDDIGEEVRKIQRGCANYPKRSVHMTVKNQLIVAKGRRSTKNLFNGRASSSVRTAREYLDSVSATEFPPALAAFAGSGSKPYRLYASVGFYKLHVIEHGILRQITDDTHRVFHSAPQYNGMSKGQVVSIANQRILDLPRSTQIAKISPFRRRADEKHAGVTGKIRRELAPFLWYALMGIPRGVEPDEDVMDQLLLKVDLLQQELLGVNKNPSFAEKTKSDIKKRW